MFSDVFPSGLRAMTSWQLYDWSNGLRTIQLNLFHNLVQKVFVPVTHMLIIIHVIQVFLTFRRNSLLAVACIARIRVSVCRTAMRTAYCKRYRGGGNLWLRNIDSWFRVIADAFTVLHLHVRGNQDELFDNSAVL